LAEAGVVAQIYQVTGIGPTLAGRNGGGDRYFTDGEIFLGVLRPDLAPSAAPPERRPSSRGVAFKQRAWRVLVSALRALPFMSRG
jgi:hypothetical protein